MKILVLGASGMLGNAVFRLFAESDGFDVIGTVRSERSRRLFPEFLQSALISGVDVENIDNLMHVLGGVKPEVVINCIGLVKQLAEADDPLAAIPINSLLPHRMARLCAVAGARFVHVSTDCVFSGSKGMYTEADFSDAKDLYGRSKFLGEVDYPNAVTLRTSIIGHELEGARSLVGWFLSQSGSVRGFKRAIFSGLPTVEIARLIRDCVLSNPYLRGLYHVSADPIDKYDLLCLLADAYGKTIDIKVDESVAIDRSLDSSRFRLVTGFQPKPWPELVKSMKDFG
ncbi:dTDP-4-dehydrorhamnose reductase family protein [Azonexus sp. IMCC34842]|uniref:dTDP-4-dehydrorhamnose reductase family protein n=1 Tax=Azonexus sp. IMCC34842 TaxID=3420950 RepID=UPI003D0ECBE5